MNFGPTLVVIIALRLKTCRVSSQNHDYNFKCGSPTYLAFRYFGTAGPGAWIDDPVNKKHANLRRWGSLETPM